MKTPVNHSPSEETSFNRSDAVDDFYFHILFYFFTQFLCRTLHRRYVAIVLSGLYSLFRSPIKQLNKFNFSIFMPVFLAFL